jgi:TonB family protein
MITTILPNAIEDNSHRLLYSMILAVVLHVVIFFVLHQSSKREYSQLKVINNVEIMDVQKVEAKNESSERSPAESSKSVFDSIASVIKPVKEAKVDNEELVEKEYARAPSGEMKQLVDQAMVLQQHHSVAQANKLKSADIDIGEVGSQRVKHDIVDVPKTEGGKKYNIVESKAALRVKLTNMSAEGQSEKKVGHSVQMLDVVGTPGQRDKARSLALDLELKRRLKDNKNEDVHDAVKGGNMARLGGSAVDAMQIVRKKAAAIKETIEIKGATGGLTVVGDLKNRKIIKIPPITYPRGVYQEASVKIMFRVFSEGKVDSDSIVVVMTSGNAVLDNHAIEIVRQLVFVPIDGGGIQAGTVIIHFTLGHH